MSLAKSILFFSRNFTYLTFFGEAQSSMWTLFLFMLYREFERILKSFFFQHWGLNSVLCMLSKHSTTWATHTPALFALGMFLYRILLYVLTSLNRVPPICASPLRWDDRHVILCTAFISWNGGLWNFFVQAGLKPWSSWSPPPKYLGLQAWANAPSF
jgi:hypothetical protein